DGEAPAGNISSAASNGTRLAWSADGRTRTVRRTWLDTFDWRLYRAGLTLQQVRSRGSVELTLTGRDGEVITAQQIAAPQLISWPRLLGALPPGPLPEHLEPVVGVRALAPVARAVSRIRDQRVLNGDDKTIARVAEDRMSVTFPAAGTPAPRLSVWPLRGYQAQAERLLESLLAAPGVAECTLDTLEANVSGTIRDVDTEFLHDLRVAVRRTRSALKLAGDALPPGLARRFAPEFRWLGALTTPTRDLDVYLLDYPGMAA